MEKLIIISTLLAKKEKREKSSLNMTNRILYDHAGQVLYLSSQQFPLLGAS